MSVTQLKKREEMDPQYQWDLTSMYADDAAFEAAYQEVAQAIDQLGQLQGTLGQSAEALLHAIETKNEVLRKFINVAVYAHLKTDQDQSNTKYQAMDAKADQLGAAYSAAVAFWEPELLSIPQETLDQFVSECEGLKLYEHYLEDATRFRDHVLSQAEEKLLAKASEIFGASSKINGMLDNADFKFPKIKNAEGQEVQLSHGLYGHLLESTDRRVRRDTFKEYYSVYDQFQNTLAATLSTKIKTDNYLADVHHFDSARQAALFENNIPEDVYDTLVDTVNSRLELLHRYVGLRKKLLELEDLEMYDMYTPLFGEPPIKITYEDAKAMVLEALQPMGDDYVAIVQEAFDEAWIDVYENIGKRSGAYSSGSYDSKPYILLNWQDSINSMYTLIHELGHSVHSYYSRNNQPYVYGGYPIFLAEIASTTNENLLTDYLLERFTQPEEQRYILNHFLDGVKGTVFRQTQFAEFEHFMHEEDAKGTPLTSEFLSDNYRELNAKYYGPQVNHDSEIALEWSRIPHFYYNYYVFQYATGFSAATAFAKRISSGDQEALEKYKGFLKSGDSEYAIDTMKRAGLDMTESRYIEETLDVFENYLDKLEGLI